MLTVFYSDFNFFITFLLSFILNWYFFFKFNFYIVRRKNKKHAINIKNNTIKKFFIFFFIKFNLLLVWLNFINIFFFKDYIKKFWWDHFFISNLNLNFYILLLVLNLFILYLIYAYSFLNLHIGLDYFFSIINLNLILPLIFFVTNVFSFFFLLEVISCLIFFKFIVSRLWYKNKFNLFDKNSTKFNKILPKNFLNLLFFQFWITFFSSIFILFFFINITFIFGSSDWFQINYLIQVETEILYFNNYFYFLFLFFIFILSIFLKIGLSPLHLFKIEVYKGLPFLTIFFYTTFYFISFFLFFLLLLLNYLISFFVYYWVILFLFLVFSCFYIIFLMFDLNFIKVFFAYSTIINSIIFFFLIFSNLNLIF